MEAGTSTAPKPDFFDRIGDAVGSAARDATTRFVDRATVFSPGVAIARGIADPEGTKESFKRVGDDAFDAISFLNPGIGIARWFAGTETGKRAVAAGAKGAVEAATLGSPLFAAGRAVVDPQGTKETYAKAGKAVKEYVESPLTGYGLAKRGYEWAKENPDTVKQAARVGFDVATLTNPVIAMGRGIASVFGGD